MIKPPQDIKESPSLLLNISKLPSNITNQSIVPLSEKSLNIVDNSDIIDLTENDDIVFDGTKKIKLEKDFINNITQHSTINTNTSLGSSTSQLVIIINSKYT